MWMRSRPFVARFRGTISASLMRDVYYALRNHLGYGRLERNPASASEQTSIADSHRLFRSELFMPFAPYVLEEDAERAF